MAIDGENWWRVVHFFFKHSHGLLYKNLTVIALHILFKASFKWSEWNCRRRSCAASSVHIQVKARSRIYNILRLYSCRNPGPKSRLRQFSGWNPHPGRRRRRRSPGRSRSNQLKGLPEGVRSRDSCTFTNATLRLSCVATSVPLASHPRRPAPCYGHNSGRRNLEGAKGDALTTMAVLELLLLLALLGRGTGGAAGEDYPPVLLGEDGGCGVPRGDDVVDGGHVNLSVAHGLFGTEVLVPGVLYQGGCFWVGG